MTSLTFTTLLVSGMALLLAIGAWYVAARSLRQCRLTSVAKLSERVTEIESTIEGLTVAQRNLRSRLNMANYRERKSSTSSSESPASVDAGENPAETRAKLNAALATGQLKVHP